MPKTKDPKKTEFNYHPYRDTREKKDFSHKMYSNKSKNGQKNFVAYNGFSVDEDDPKFQIGATGAGLTLRSTEIIKREAHSHRSEKLALNRILTYLAENMLSYLNSVGFSGLAEVQIGWVSDLNCLLITENNVKQFNSKISLYTFHDFLKIITTMGTSKMRTQGVAGYFKHRMARHSKKLMELLDDSSKRYRDWIGYNADVESLIEFLNDELDDSGIYILTDTNNISDMQNKIVYYHSSFSFSSPTKHAEQYHLATFEAIAKVYNDNPELGDIPKFYVAGTKRPCSTCAGTLKDYAQKPLLNGRLYADYDHPGNLWTAQHINQSDLAVSFTDANLVNHNINITCYHTPGENPKSGFATGYNSDSDSENEYMD